MKDKQYSALHLKSKRFYVISSLLLQTQGKAVLLIVLT